MKKSDLRTHYRQKRNLLSEDDVQALSQQITTQFFEYFGNQSRAYLHTFLPIQAQKEVNTWLIIQEIWKRKMPTKVVVAKSDFQNISLENFLLEKDTLLVENKWGITEPQEAKPVAAQMLDIILMPLLAFDEQGYRVGYGKGFYDRFLKTCREDALKIGLSFFEAVPSITDTNHYDIPLDFVLTPEQVYQFKNQ